MARLISAVILLTVTFICHLNVSTGYKWVKVNKGSALPSNSVPVKSPVTYVGRVVLSNTVQPVEVYNSSYAEVFNTYTNTFDPVKQFDVLTATEKCEWVIFSGLSDVPVNVVRAGSAWNGEPIYLRRRAMRIASILKTSKQLIPPYKEDFEYALVCAETAIWVDATPPVVPKNATAVKKGIFIARLMGPSSYIPAIIRNDTNFCSTTFNEIEIKSPTCQVLTENSGEYSWQRPSLFERIPENALQVGQNEYNESIYVGRDTNFDRSLKLISFSSVLKAPSAEIDILVKN